MEDPYRHFFTNEPPPQPRPAKPLTEDDVQRDSNDPYIRSAFNDGNLVPDTLTAAGLGIGTGFDVSSVLSAFKKGGSVAPGPIGASLMLGAGLLEGGVTPRGYGGFADQFARQDDIIDKQNKGLIKKGDPRYMDIQSGNPMSLLWHARGAPALKTLARTLTSGAADYYSSKFGTFGPKQEEGESDDDYFMRTGNYPHYNEPMFESISRLMLGPDYEAMPGTLRRKNPMTGQPFTIEEMEATRDAYKAHSEKVGEELKGYEYFSPIN